MKKKFRKWLINRLHAIPREDIPHDIFIQLWQFWSKNKVADDCYKLLQNGFTSYYYTFDEKEK